MTRLQLPLLDKAWTQTDSEAGITGDDDAAAEVLCEHCQRPSDVTMMFMDAQSRLLCAACWSVTWRLLPLTGAA